jgi:hypothetical protein
VSRRRRFQLFFVFALLAGAPPARAQGPIEDAGPMATTTATTERPVRGPAVRERSGRRSRGASTASGVLMLVMLIGFMGYYVVKKLRR